MADQAQNQPGDQIARDLRTKALQASRLPDSHKGKVHGEIDALIDLWELNQELASDG